MKESECMVFRVYVNGEVCFKVIFVGRFIEVRLKFVEFKLDVFSSFEEFVESSYVCC